MWFFWKVPNKSEYRVGYVDDNEWHWEIKTTSPVEAMRVVNYLNGGTGNPPPMSDIKYG